VFSDSGSKGAVVCNLARSREPHEFSVNAVFVGQERFFGIANIRLARKRDRTRDKKAPTRPGLEVSPSRGETRRLHAGSDLRCSLPPLPSPGALVGVQTARLLQPKLGRRRYSMGQGCESWPRSRRWLRSSQPACTAGCLKLSSLAFGERFRRC
jgi:hypothetical protein